MSNESLLIKVKNIGVGGEQSFDKLFYYTVCIVQG